MTIYDIILVGAGPCGLAAAADFKQAGKRVLHLEKGALSQTIRLFPKGVRLFSPWSALQIDGVVFPGEPTKPPLGEEYVDYLRSVIETLKLQVHTWRDIESVTRQDSLFRVAVCNQTDRTMHYLARNIVVATGGYYKPVLLGIPGELLPLVTHRFHSDAPARGQHVLVVGGGNSAIEACTVLARKGAHVVLSYRHTRIPRARLKPWLLADFDAGVKNGRIKLKTNTMPLRIDDSVVTLQYRAGRQEQIPCDRVLLLTGYGPDYTLLKMLDVPFHKQTRRPLFSPRTLETKVPGVFLCGTIVLKWQGKQANIENTKGHGEIILRNMR